MKKMNRCIFFVSLMLCCQLLPAQENESEEKKGFKKDKLFTGGGLSVSIFQTSYLIGVNPVFGYSLTRWADLGIVGNYNYTSYRDYRVINDKLRQSVYGGGIFTRLFPVRFLFAQAQVERNRIKLKYTPAPVTGDISETRYATANSYLVGAGFASGRDPDGGGMYSFLAILFDISKDVNSPYTDNRGGAIPIFRAGINIPLFQKSR